MNIVVLNGSGRKGNTVAAIEAFSKGASAHSIEVIETYKVNVAPCKGCGACGCYKGCVDQDDTNEVVDKLVAADLIIFATPVYWWGITAQLKMVLDKCYCRGAQLKGKKVGLIVVGGSPVDNEQYELIRRQFACIEQYLDWKILFQQSYCANAIGSLAANEEVVKELIEIGKNI